jgi:hypothetical protein
MRRTTWITNTQRRSWDIGRCQASAVGMPGGAGLGSSDQAALTRAEGDDAR